MSKDVEGWRASSKFRGPKQQDDIYLIFPATDIGVKASRDELQVKIRRSAADFHNNQGSTIGQMELWSKTALPLASSDSDPFEEVHGPRFVTNKKRYKKRFETDIEAGKLNPTDKRIDLGIAVDLTNLEVGDKDWWTVGFDAIGTKIDEQPKILEFAVNLVLAELPRDIFRKQDSFSYPEWLSTL